jgi:hypothetical protein
MANARDECESDLVQAKKNKDLVKMQLDLVADEV